MGRISGLAVALGVSAAVLTGQGVASAAPDATGSDATSESASSTSSTETETETTESSQSAQSAQATDIESAPTDDADDQESTPLQRVQKRWEQALKTKPAKSEPKSTVGNGRAANFTESARDTTEADTDEAETEAESNEAETAEAEAEIETAEPQMLGDPRPVEEPAPADDDVIPAAQDTPSTSTVDVVVEQLPDPQPQERITVVISELLTAVFNPFAGAGDTPAAPAGAPAVWALAAAARREFLGAVPDLDPQLNPAATAAVQPVVAIAVTPILAPLQHIPILGPLVITPIVATLKQIPLIGDILHPIIGYPLGATGGTTPRDVYVISADGTPIYVHFFPAQGTAKGTVAPTILYGSGLGLPGETNPLAMKSPFLPNQVIGIGMLLRAGYNVVTWDPRGEWSSGGRLEIDHPDYEGQDMVAIITWVSQQPEALLDAPGDPRIGMAGASYGGGIQLVTAAIDHRVDAIVPTIAWHNLNTALDKNGATKSSWGAILSAALLFTGARVNPRIYSAVAIGLITGQLPKVDQNFLDARSPSQLLENITAPTLLIQGTVDTLFTLQEAHDNAMVLIGNGVPTKVVWYCGGHGACITSTNNGEVIERATLDWLDRYVKGLPVSTGPQFEWVDQHGQNFGSDTYPVKPATPLTISSAAGGTLPLLPLLGGSGPNFSALRAGPLGALLGILSGAKAINAVNLTTAKAATTTYIVGAPELEFTYSGAGFTRHVYAQLVDDSTGLVLGNQVTPIPVTLDGKTHTVKISLEPVAHTLAPGQTVTVQIVASAVTYQAIWTLGEVRISDITLTLPTADASAISTPDTETAAVPVRAA
ncbi:CocE/NonD family hydrolase [Mycolicibacterium holsaticum]|uniref:S15 peptidase family protein n=1 Tax=Mycolicibacterium holsaticum TaxID=152142 RepID=UPI001E36AD14|nr:CocE/NonD family hydrolase [Mycolicibacterium holsaticum]MDA4110206.1 peptidase S15 [Mycolicibacterium holsaticum DSM 44478 = JCM 12374]